MKNQQCDGESDVGSEGLITRRCFELLVLGLTLGTGAHTAAADDALKRAHIATLGPGPPSCPPVSALVAFAKGMTELGYGPESVVESRCFSELAELAELPGLAAELLKGKPALVVVWGSVVAAQAIRQASPSIPIVFVDVSDSVRFGLVQSLGHPGGNSTGISNNLDELQTQKVQILRDALPRATRLALLCNLANPLQADYLRILQGAAQKMRFETHTYSVQKPGDLEGAFTAMAADRMDAMALLPDAWFFPIRQQVIALAGRQRIPAIYGNSLWPDLGALYTYGADLDDMSYRAATYVDKILRGAKPADIPVELPTKYNFVINAKTARDMGIVIPGALMLRATRVID